MGSLTHEQTMALNTLIYHERMADHIPRNGSITVGDLIVDLGNRNHSGAEMSNDDWNRALSFVVSDPVLSSLTINGSNFSDDSRNNTNQTTGFRAMTVTDPRGNVNPTVIFRGSVGYGHQWHDNFSPASGVTISPHMVMAREYILRLGMANIDVSGHSKGGNLAEAMAFLLPPGMINRAISQSGQNQSDAFLAALTQMQRDNGFSRTFLFNEWRDPIAMIFAHNMNAANTFFFVADIDFNNVLFYHRPDLFLYANGFWRADANYLSLDDKNLARLLNNLPEWAWIGRLFANILGDPPHWCARFYWAVLQANNVYLDLLARRLARLSNLLAQFCPVMLEKYNAEDSEVVDGAIIFCDYGDALGELRLASSHGRTTRGRPVLAATDTTVGVNIIFEDGKCFGLSWNHLEGVGLGETPLSSTVPPGSIEKNCIPDTDGNEWLITDDDKTISIGGASVNAVLRKSVLVCNNGGIIQIVLSGQ